MRTNWKAGVSKVLDCRSCTGPKVLGTTHVLAEGLSRASSRPNFFVSPRRLTNTLLQVCDELRLCSASHSCLSFAFKTCMLLVFLSREASLFLRLIPLQ